MIFYKICPLCQNVCKIQEWEQNDVSGFCEHLNFTYNFATHQNSIIIDIVTDDIYAMLSLAGPEKMCYIKSISNSKELTLNFIPIDWNDFELDSFTQKMKKILEMKTFV